MINKAKIGKYLKNLRLQKKRDKDGKSFSQEDLAVEFSKRGIIISINAIAEWEKGITLPSPENLEILSKIYNKSLDEILDGEDSNDVNYANIYFISKPNWGRKFDNKANLYQIRNEQIKLITSRFKELLINRMEKSFSSNEENELRFLFNNFYHVSNYIEKFTQIEVNDEYIKFKDAINEILIENKNMSINEKFWEIQKLYSENNELWFNHWRDVHDLKNVSILQERFKEIEDWQKDMLLAMFQNLETCDANPEQYGSHYLKRYEEINGEYNHETIVKSEIKELINRGACLNKYFLNIKKGYFETKRIIDRLEELYELCLKPIEVHMTDEQGNAVSYKIENNLKNRFLNKYYFSLKFELKGYEDNGNYYSDIDEIYEWFININEIPDEFYLNIAKKHNIDITQDKKLWLLDAKQISHLEKYLKEFKDIEKKIAEGLIEIKELKTKLYSGEKEYKIHRYKVIGGKDEKSIRDYIEYWKQKLDYSEYLKSRDKALTKNLLADLKILSLKDIKEKYFKMEVIEGE